jgi:hypothetical protein
VAFGAGYTAMLIWVGSALVAGEIGENDCAESYIDPLMTWLDSKKASYLAWAWNADFSCSCGPGQRRPDRLWRGLRVPPGGVGRHVGVAGRMAIGARRCPAIAANVPPGRGGSRRPQGASLGRVSKVG